MEALSDSTVTSDCSTLMLSPTLTSTSMTVTSLKSPMSGTWISTEPVAAALAVTGRALGAIDSGAACARISWAGGTFNAESELVSALSRLKTIEPCFTLSPSLTLTSLTTPAALDGISIDALSDSTVNSDWSALMVSPGLTSNSITVTSSKSPMSGTAISMVAMCLLQSVGDRATKRFAYSLFFPAKISYA